MQQGLLTCPSEKGKRAAHYCSHGGKTFVVLGVLLLWDSGDIVAGGFTAMFIPWPEDAFWLVGWWFDMVEYIIHKLQAKSQSSRTSGKVFWG